MGGEGGIRFVLLGHVRHAAASGTHSRRDAHTRQNPELQCKIAYQYTDTDHIFEHHFTLFSVSHLALAIYRRSSSTEQLENRPPGARSQLISIRGHPFILTYGLYIRSKNCAATPDYRSVASRSFAGPVLYCRTHPLPRHNTRQVRRSSESKFQLSRIV